MFDKKRLQGFVVGATLAAFFGVAALPAKGQVRQPIILDPIFEIRAAIMELAQRTQAVERALAEESKQRKALETEVNSLKSRLKAVEDALQRSSKAAPGNKPPEL